MARILSFLVATEGEYDTLCLTHGFVEGYRFSTSWDAVLEQ